MVSTLGNTESKIVTLNKCRLASARSRSNIAEIYFIRRQVNCPTYEWRIWIKVLLLTWPFNLLQLPFSATWDVNFYASKRYIDCLQLDAKLTLYKYHHHFHHLHRLRYTYHHHYFHCLHKLHYLLLVPLIYLTFNTFHMYKN